MAWANEPKFHRLKAFIQSGVIGKVKEVHNWTNRPIWPQGWMENPTEKMKVPRGLDWDLWLGPVPTVRITSITLTPLSPWMVRFRQRLLW